MNYPEEYRVAGNRDDEGMFKIRYESFQLAVIASTGGGWNHVSVSLKSRNPNWNQMCFIKDLFFGENEYVVQYHPPKSEYINSHKHCLHLWQPNQGQEMSFPPSILVGIK